MHHRIDLFLIFEKIDKLIFRLRLSSIIKIHSIINITQLKSKLSKTNSYNKSLNFESSSIVEANFETFFYILKRILNKRIFRDQIYFLVKWKDYNNEHNVWYSVKALNDVQKLIAKYETNVKKRIQLNSQRVRISRRKFFTTNQASLIYQSEIKVRISRRTAFKSLTSIKREAKFSRRQSFR